MAHDTKNFKVSEFSCHCGCGYNVIDQRVINMAQTIRNALGEPVRVNSGCRCKKHNATVSKVPNSYHTQGLAADLSCVIGAEALFIAIRSLYDLGHIPELSWACWYKSANFVHVDCGKVRRSVFSEHK